MSTLKNAAAKAIAALKYYHSAEDYQPTPAGEAIAALRAALAEADRRKPCTCHDTSRGPGRPCAVKSGNALGELWRCVEEAEAPKAEPDGWVVGTYPPWIKPRAFGSLEEAEAWCDRYDVPKHKDGLIRPFRFVDDVRAPKAEPVALSDEAIIAIRDEHLPAQGEPFDCMAFARAVLAHGRKG